VKEVPLAAKGFSPFSYLLRLTPASLIKFFFFFFLMAGYRTLPFLPGKVMLLPGQKKSELAKSRVPELNKYVCDLNAMAPKISRSNIFQDFLKRGRLDDAAEELLSKSLLFPFLILILMAGPGPFNIHLCFRTSSENGGRGQAVTAAPAAPADTATTSSGSGAGSGARVVTGKPSGDLSGEKSRVLFSAGEDVDTGWKGKYQKSTVERNPDQYEAFASPWSKTSQFKLDNLRFCEISLDIVYAVEVFDRKDLMHTFENVSTGSDIAAWLCDHVEGMDTPLEAQQVGQELLNCGIYLPCNPDRIFKCESGSFYRPLVRFLPLFCVGISSYFALS